MTQMPSSDVDYKIFDFLLRHCLLWLFWWEILAPKRPTVSAKWMNEWRSEIHGVMTEVENKVVSNTWLSRFIHYRFRSPRPQFSLTTKANFLATQTTLQVLVIQTALQVCRPQNKVSSFQTTLQVLTSSNHIKSWNNKITQNKAQARLSLFLLLVPIAGLHGEVCILLLVPIAGLDGEMWTCAPLFFIPSFASVFFTTAACASCSNVGGSKIDSGIGSSPGSCPGWLDPVPHLVAYNHTHLVHRTKWHKMRICCVS